MSGVDTSAENIARVLRAAPFADWQAGIPQMCDLIKDLAAERDALVERENERNDDADTTIRELEADRDRLAAERDALLAPRGHATCAHCGGQNGWIEADMAAEVERRSADYKADRDRLAAEVARLRATLEVIKAGCEAYQRGQIGPLGWMWAATHALTGATRHD